MSLLSLPDVGWKKQNTRKINIIINNLCYLLKAMYTSLVLILVLFTAQVIKIDSDISSKGILLRSQICFHRLSIVRLLAYVVIYLEFFEIATAMAEKGFQLCNPQQGPIFGQCRINVPYLYGVKRKWIENVWWWLRMVVEDGG
jgi:hypothetical protein